MLLPDDGQPGSDPPYSLQSLIFGRFPARPEQLTENPVSKEVRPRVGSALPRIKDNKTIRVTDEDAPEEYCGQQSIFLGC
jgi:hypothetical protein